MADNILGGNGVTKAFSLCCFNHPRGVVIKTSSKDKVSPLLVVRVISPPSRVVGVSTLTTLTSSRMLAFSRGNFAIRSKIASYVVSMNVSSASIRDGTFVNAERQAYLHHSTPPNGQTSSSAS